MACKHYALLEADTSILLLTGSITHIVFFVLQDAGARRTRRLHEEHRKWLIKVISQTYTQQKAGLNNILRMFLNRYYCLFLQGYTGKVKYQISY